jgi:hypothetical protein
MERRSVQRRPSHCAQSSRHFGVLRAICDWKRRAAVSMRGGCACLGSPPRLGEMNRKMAHNRRAAPLLNTGATARHLRAGYAEIMDRCGAALAPRHFHVFPI